MKTKLSTLNSASIAPASAAAAAGSWSGCSSTASGGEGLLIGATVAKGDK